MLNRRFVLFLLVIISGNIFSQDVHFSQYYNAFQSLNPALTGRTGDVIRMGMLYRNQWSSISTPYKTYTAFAEGRFTTRRLTRTWFGTGVNAYNDHSGDGTLTNNVAVVSFSVTQGFTPYNTFLVSMGFSVGLINRSVDVSNLVFDEQWDGVKFNPDLSSNENFASQSVFAPEFNFGVSVFYEFNNSLQLSAGVSMMHINKPKTSFYDDDNRIDRKIIFNTTGRIIVNNDLALEPSAFFSIQSGTSEFIFGTNANYGKSEFKTVFGLWCRWGRDIIPAVGLNYRMTNFLLTYDVNISRLNNATGYRGGVEISLIQRFGKRRRRYPCSDFK